MRKSQGKGKRVARSAEELKQTAIAIFEMRMITDPTVNFKECVDKLKATKLQRRKNRLRK